MVPAITSFNFGLATNYTTPTIEPEPEQAVAYTVYHIGRVLEQITLGGPGVTIPPIFEAFPVRPCCCLSPRPHTTVTVLMSHRVSRSFGQSSPCSVTARAC